MKKLFILFTASALVLTACGPREHASISAIKPPTSKRACSADEKFHIQKLLDYEISLLRHNKNAQAYELSSKKFKARANENQFENLLGDYYMLTKSSKTEYKDCTAYKGAYEQQIRVFEEDLWWRMTFTVEHEGTKFAVGAVSLDGLN